MRRLGVVAGVLLAALAAGSIAAATVNVHVGSYYFEDATIDDGRVVAKVGDQLRFLIDDSGGGNKPHTVVVAELGIDSGALLQGSTFVTPVLDTPGTFTLFCRVHRANFDHFTTLVVTGQAATPKPTPAPTPPPTPKVTPAPTATQPAPTSGSSAAPVPTGGSGATAAPSVGAGGTPTPGATPGPSDSPAPGAASSQPSATPDEPLPPGVTGPPTLTWLRSVLVGALVLPGIAIVAAAAWLVASRRTAGHGG